jgi:glycosyltransferase involved in cell wall biosynthesis
VNASAILTYRGEGGGERRANLDAVLARLAALPGVEVIVVEQDRAPTLAPSAAAARCTHAFAPNAGPFNKSWGFNVGARMARGAVLAFCDADLLVGDSLDEALDLCMRGYAVAKPYVRMIDLDAQESAAIREGRAAAASIDAARPGREAIGEHIVLCGGLFAIRRDALVHVGGFDERFVGWGGEDDAMTIKVERARLSCVELDREVALHLHHPRPAAATFGHAHYAANRALLDNYARYDDATLARLAEVQWQLAGHPDKYRDRAS